MKFRFQLLFIISLTVPTHFVEAQEIAKWNCVVEECKGFEEEDQGFVLASLAKRFTQFFSATEVLAKVTSDSFEDSETRFIFSTSDTHSRHGGVEGGLGFETISLPLDPGRHINEDGFLRQRCRYRATFTLTLGC